ncbi:hypothetical protein ACFQY0_04560 [Haloferula chungangensis]|uniref:Uncharacterized protein n=1 Tax=Haloferula chungangensis TaxID=1048331 RepID=A0ABW2L4J7_9BACT
MRRFYHRMAFPLVLLACGCDQKQSDVVEESGRVVSTDDVYVGDSMPLNLPVNGGMSGPCNEIGWNYKVAPYIAVAAHLQMMGKEEAIRILESWADSGNHEDQIIIFCRMLFTTKRKQDFEAPLLGRPVYMGQKSLERWYLSPIEIYDGIPILVTDGYCMEGIKGTSRMYLNYCIKNCEWSEQRYSPVSLDQLKVVIGRWLDETKWLKPLTDRQRTFFVNQANELEG